MIPTLAIAALVMRPASIGDKASYAIAFDAEYGGYVERYEGSLNLDQLTETSVSIDGTNDRTTEDEISHLGKRHTTVSTAPFVSRRDSAFGALQLDDSKAGVADQIFDYNALLSLLPPVSTGLKASSWPATTRCWVSDRVTADVPVSVSVQGDRDAVLTATGSKKIALGTTGDAAYAELTVRIVERFRDGVLTESTMHARESFERHGMPAGGGVYAFTLRLKGSSS